jgi:hypothetical protein
MTLDCSYANRHCPRCQGHKTIEWASKQEDKRLPVEYHLVTFTIPEPLRSLFLLLREKAYALMFECSKEVIRDILKWKYGIVTSGFTSALHTWGSQLQYHPHVHVLLPGCGLNESGDAVVLPKGFGLPVKAASKRWRGALLSKLEDLVGRESLPKSIAKEKFVIHSKAVGDGHQAIRYLSRYVFKTAISDSRIKKVAENVVRFSKGKGKGGDITLKPDEFVRRFLQHVLASGFARVRHYGFLNACSKVDLKELKVLIYQFSKQLLEMIPDKKEASPKAKRSPPRCRCCGKAMRLVSVNRNPPFRSSA